MDAGRGGRCRCPRTARGRNVTGPSSSPRVREAADARQTLLVHPPLAEYREGRTSSTALPKVALRRPPTVWPRGMASCSVASPRSLASGMIETWQGRGRRSAVRTDSQCSFAEGEFRRTKEKMKRHLALSFAKEGGDTRSAESGGRGQRDPGGKRRRQRPGQLHGTYDQCMCSATKASGAASKRMLIQLLSRCSADGIGPGTRRAGRLGLRDRSGVVSEAAAKGRVAAEGQPWRGKIRLSREMQFLERIRAENVRMAGGDGLSLVG